jgi:hypothetical protein
MNLNALPIVALPLPPPAGPQPAPSSTPVGPNKSLPLAQRLTLNPTITAKVNYFDLAQTRRAPFDLRTALIWLCLCAHDNSVWWEPRTPDHRDGEDDPPLPFKLNFAAWLNYIEGWQNETFAPNESEAVEQLALRVWLTAHATVVVPEQDSKKNGTTDPALTGLSFTYTPSAAETSAGATTSSTPCPSAPSTPSSTHGSEPAGFPASAPQSPDAATPRSTP